MSVDPLATLRAYRRLAPWNLRDLAATAAGILERAAVRPLNATAAAEPSERTIRYYVTRGLVSPPAGRGTAASYSYRHLLQVLGIKLRQMEGATLDVIAREMVEVTGDVLERRVAAALGAGLTGPDSLRVAGAGRAFQAERSVAETGVRSGYWRRLAIAPGAELHLSDSHPLAGDPEREAKIADAVRAALAAHLPASDGSAR